MVMIQKNLYQFFIAQVTHIFDVFYYHYNRIIDSGYEGLLSSILSVFAYLQYCVQILSCSMIYFYGF
jgi:hypothetical protein